MIGPELVAGDGQGDQVEQGGDPAVEGGLLVAGVQGSHPLLHTALLTRLTAHRGTFTRQHQPTQALSQVDSNADFAFVTKEEILDQMCTKFKCVGSG